MATCEMRQYVSITGIPGCCSHVTVTPNVFSFGPGTCPLTPPMLITVPSNKAEGQGPAAWAGIPNQLLTANFALAILQTSIHLVMLKLMSASFATSPVAPTAKRVASYFNLLQSPPHHQPPTTV